MRTKAYQHKIRIIQHGDSNTTTYGVTIPVTFKHWFGSLVTIRESGGALILESGGKPEAISIKQLKKDGLTLERVKI